MTSLPTNESELQLYRVLQRANLLKYYDSFISHGESSTEVLPSLEMWVDLTVVGLVNAVSAKFFLYCS